MDDFYGLVLIAEYFDGLSEDLFCVFRRLSDLIKRLKSMNDEQEYILYAGTEFKKEFEILYLDISLKKINNSFEYLRTAGSIWNENIERYKSEYSHINYCEETLELLKKFIIDSNEFWLLFSNEIYRISVFTDSNSISIRNIKYMFLMDEENYARYRILIQSKEELYKRFDKLIDDVMKEDDRNPDKSILNRINEQTGCCLDQILENDGNRLADELSDIVLNNMRKYHDDYDCYSFFHEFVETVQNADSDFWGLSGRWYPRDEEASVKFL